MRAIKIEKILYIDNECMKNGQYESELACLLFKEDTYEVYFYTVRGFEYLVRPMSTSSTLFEYLNDSEDGKVKVCSLNDAMIMVKPEVYETLCQYLKKD